MGAESSIFRFQGMKTPKFAQVCLLVILLAAGVQSASARRQNAMPPSTAQGSVTRSPLAETPYATLPLGQVKAEGWLDDQLRRAADGLTGRLDELYETVGPSNAWRGGEGDSWERGPYWLDGLVPLAHLLDDETLKAKAQPWIEWILSSQREDGYFGPRPDDASASTYQLQRASKEDWWPRMVVLKVLQSHFEATGDERVLPFMARYFRYQLDHLRERPLDHWTQWARSRGGENQASVLWLYDRVGDPTLLELSDLLFEQTLDWTAAFERDWPDRSYAPTHVVNVAMGVKQPAVQYLRTGDERFLAAVVRGLQVLRDRHGQVQGMFSGDEMLHGTDPTQGTELCAIVEFMYSLETLMWISGDVAFADHLERVAYNALPAHVADDFMTRQYFQQPNQVRISVQSRNFATDHSGTDLCFGLLSGYPCCTTNMHQGWPKFVQHLWLSSRDGGLAALAYGPSRVTTRLPSGVEVTIREETAYPFEEQIRFVVQPDTAVRFPLHLRIPAWADSARLEVNGGLINTFAGGRVAVVEGVWQPGDEVVLHLPMNVTHGRWHENAVSVERGPLVYALPIADREQQVPSPSAERYGTLLQEIHPTQPWNYGLLLTGSSDGVQLKQTELTGYPWTVSAVPVRLQMIGRRIPRWVEYNHSAGPLPYSPVRSEEADEDLELVPYGATRLRVSTFPELVP